ncbi:MAG TPA: immune inhibitor A domain-containing protein, partial [Terriglobales bacterium]|nr:immune inhibitor A domain-containing protein [Terriglobales bacterium]
MFQKVDIERLATTLILLILVTSIQSVAASSFHQSNPLNMTLDHALNSGRIGQGLHPSQSAKTLGVVRVLVIAVAFSDVKPTMPIVELKREWFGTVPSYYSEISYGKLKIQGDLYGWYTLPYTHTHYGRDCKAINDADCSGINQSWKIANDTIALVQKDVNFANYDYFMFIHAGEGQETSQVKNDIWSVTYFNASITTSSITLESFSIVPEIEAAPNVANGDWCVEFAHLLGVPDLYDITNGPDNGKTL